MWENIVGYLPKNILIICTTLSFIIPFTIYKINDKLHDYGDPSWRKEDKDKSSSE